MSLLSLSADMLLGTELLLGFTAPAHEEAVQSDSESEAAEDQHLLACSDACMAMPSPKPSPKPSISYPALKSFFQSANPFRFRCPSSYLFRRYPLH